MGSICILHAATAADTALVVVVVVVIASTLIIAIQLKKTRTETA